jgi:hypothetical protein
MKNSKKETSLKKRTMRILKMMKTPTMKMLMMKMKMKRKRKIVTK